MNGQFKNLEVAVQIQFTPTELMHLANWLNVIQFAGRKDGVREAITIHDAIVGKIDEAKKHAGIGDQPPALVGGPESGRLY